MKDDQIKRLLEQVAASEVSVEDALHSLKMQPYKDIGFAKLDYHRELRQGVPEVVYAAGKTVGQTLLIAEDLYQESGKVLLTRLSEEAALRISEKLPLKYYEIAKIGYIGDTPKADKGSILIFTGGTSDMPVAEEAATAAELLGNNVTRCYDVGVAGLHRLLDHLNYVTAANVIIVVAGMEGALASVVGGLADCPVVAVPTSVGYGASFHGLSALLSMLNACAPGIGVVNIDNGFGAAVLAHRINGGYGK